MNSIGDKLPDYIKQHRKIGLSIPWDDIILNQPYFRKHLDKMHLSNFFNLGKMGQIDVKSLVNNFVTGNKEDYALIRQIFFLSLWYDTYFG
jgi:asparagine synthase (glutamine-hydrolysing)